MLRRRRPYRLRPERSGGVLHRRTPHVMRGKAEALAAISRRTVRNGRKQGRDWCGGMEPVVLTAYGQLRA